MGSDWRGTCFHPRLRIDGIVTITRTQPSSSSTRLCTGTPMDEASCDEAFRMAAEFFAPQFKGAPIAFVCHSWLLFPKHEEMLAETTNVRKFMKRFDIFESGEYGSYDELWRLFDRPFKSADSLAYDSSLRRAYVDLIRAGGKTGWGHGVFLY